MRPDLRLFFSYSRDGRVGVVALDSCKTGEDSTRKPGFKFGIQLVYLAY